MCKAITVAVEGGREGRLDFGDVTSAYIQMLPGRGARSRQWGWGWGDTYLEKYLL